jgi:hypothetical protein
LKPTGFDHHDPRKFETMSIPSIFLLIFFYKKIREDNYFFYFSIQIHSIINFLNLFLYCIFFVIFNDMNSIFAISYGNQNQSLQYMFWVYITWQKKSIKFLRIQMEKMVIESEGREGELGHI